MTLAASPRAPARPSAATQPPAILRPKACPLRHPSNRLLLPSASMKKARSSARNSNNLRKHSNPHGSKYGDKPWAGCSRDGCLKHHHGPEHFAPFHLVERLFNLIEGNSLRYEPFEVEPAL
jgi:hypothetical protein